MKVVLEFNIPEDQYQLWCAHNGQRVVHAADDIRNCLRQHYKYGASADDTVRGVDDILKDLYNVTGDPLEQ